MPYSYTRICPICQKVGIQDISRHLRFAHKLSSEERKPYLKSTQYQVKNGDNVYTNKRKNLLDKMKVQRHQSNENTLNTKLKKVENAHKTKRKSTLKTDKGRRKICVSVTENNSSELEMEFIITANLNCKDK